MKSKFCYSAYCCPLYLTESGGALSSSNNNPSPLRPASNSSPTRYNRLCVPAARSIVFFHSNKVVTSNARFIYYTKRSSQANTAEGGIRSTGADPADDEDDANPRQDEIDRFNSSIHTENGKRVFSYYWKV